MDSIEEFKNKNCNCCIHNADTEFEECNIVTNIKGNIQCIYFKDKEKTDTN